MMRRIALAALCAFGTVGPAVSGEADPLIPHRAIYDISLDRTTGSDVLTARGRMAVQFKNTCDGWSTAQRLIADMTDSKGVVTRTDYFVTAWESKDGRDMRFDVSNMRDGKPLSRERGEATLDADGSGKVQFTNGKLGSFPLPKGTEFPTTEMLDIVHAAQRGQSSFKHIVFQGGGRESLNLSTAVIQKPSDPAKLTPDLSVDRVNLLRGTDVWTVLISYFSLNARIEQPDYE